MAASVIAPQNTATDDDLSDLIGYNMKRVYSLLQTDLVPLLAGFKLRAVSFSALSVIVNAPGVNQTQLAAALNIERSNLVQIIDELVSLNLIERKPVKGDRRRHALMPTPEGITTFAQAKQAITDQEQAFFAILTAEDHKSLHRILAQLRNRP